MKITIYLLSHRSKKVFRCWVINSSRSRSGSSGGIVVGKTTTKHQWLDWVLGLAKLAPTFTMSSA